MGETATAREGETNRESDTQRASRRWWTVVVFAYMALEGAALQMRGAVVPALRETFTVPEWQLGLVAPAGTISFLLVVMLVGAIGGRFDTRRLLLLAVVGTGVGVLVMGVAPSFLFFLAAAFGRESFVGVGRGSARPLLSHLYPAQRGRLFGYYDMMWAVGATIGPLLVAAALVVGDWRLAYFALVVAFVPLLLLVRSLPTPSVGGGDDPLDLTAVRGLARRPEVVAMSAAVFLIAGFEGGIFTWLTTYAEGRLPGSVATASLSVLLVAYIPGRFLSGRLSERFGYVRLATGLVALTVPAFAYAFFVAEGYGLLVGFFAIGLGLSGLYPTMVAYGVESVPEYSTPVNSTAAVTSSAGFAAVPAIMGFVISGSDVLRAMRLLLLPLCVLLALLLVTWSVIGTAND
ncbi:MFS transporter [Haloarcula nitratireducens]|uniref:MFS transporter n=1 Tax=Haloarcula nitratireducens TaxID=2487749 RepID=A0AAW4PDP3_9EURY|nr:MFS transporter [Halomicroarcula nitratireducens]MBX0296025.1 MFS transporter [Halomicroarcula nitratireducens]